MKDKERRGSKGSMIIHNSLIRSLQCTEKGEENPRLENLVGGGGRVKGAASIVCDVHSCRKGRKKIVRYGGRGERRATGGLL